MTFNAGRTSEKKIKLFGNGCKSSVFYEKLLRNWGKLSEFAKICSGTGVNYQNLAKNVQTPGVNCKKTHDSDKTPGDNCRKTRDSDKTPGVNEQKSHNSDKTPGDNHLYYFQK